MADGKVNSSEVIDTNGTGHGALAGFLGGIGVEVLICGGIGGGAIAAMNGAGIKVYAGASGSADEAINAYVNGNLPWETGWETGDGSLSPFFGPRGRSHGLILKETENRPLSPLEGA